MEGWSEERDKRESREVAEVGLNSFVVFFCSVYLKRIKHRQT